jgi:hypothetical protein
VGGEWIVKGWSVGGGGGEGEGGWIVNTGVGTESQKVQFVGSTQRK